MANNYGPYGICGNVTDDSGEVWYPHWSIEVRDGSFSQPTWFYGSLNKVDLKAELLRISAKHPLQEVWLIAESCARMVARFGEIVGEHRYEDFWPVGPEEEKDAEIFNDVICCDHNIYGIRFR